MKTAEFGQPCRVPEPGRCRICGRGSQSYWADETRTLCDAPRCIAAARAELTVDPSAADDLLRPYDGERYGFAPLARPRWAGAAPPPPDLLDELDAF